MIYTNGVVMQNTSSSFDISPADRVQNAQQNARKREIYSHPIPPQYLYIVLL